MELVNKDIKIFGPMCDVLDKKNINNCIYYSKDNLEGEHRLFIDVSRLGLVNREILYTMADVFIDRFSFTDTLFDDKNLFSNYSGLHKKDNFSKHSLVCFSIPDFGSEFNDYTKGFFLELANCFVTQEPIPVIKDLFTKEEMVRYNKYYSDGREDQKDISLVVSLGVSHPLRKDSREKAAARIYFSNGYVVNRNSSVTNGIHKQFSLTTDRALNNLKRYDLEKKKEELAKQKVKRPTNG